MSILSQYNAAVFRDQLLSLHNSVSLNKSTQSESEVQNNIPGYISQNSVIDISKIESDIDCSQVDKRAKIVATKAGSLLASEQDLIYAASKAHLFQVSQLMIGAMAVAKAAEHIRNAGYKINTDILLANKAATKAQKNMIYEIIHQFLRLAAPGLKSLNCNAAPISIKAPDATIAPQIFKRHDGTYNLIRAVPPIENLILPGGGSKGIGLAGALLELESAGMLSSLRAIAGSSAGALVATWLSVGRSLPELEVLFGGDFRNLLKTDKGLNFLYPDIKFVSTAAVTAKLLSPFGAGHDTAIGMIKKLDEVTAEGVRDYLIKQNPDDLACSIKAIAKREVDAKVIKGEISEDPAAINAAVEQRAKYILDRFNTLQEKADFSKSRQGKMVTFEDIAFLHAIAPDKFKSLRITAYDLAKKDHVIFDEHIAPNLPVAYAARASMAHPLIATGVSFQGNTWSGTGHTFSDGGISSNMPVEALVPLTAPKAATGLPAPAYQRLRAATAVMAFDEDGTAMRTINHSPEIEWNNRGFFKRIVDYISYGVMGWVASNPDIAKDNLDDVQKTHDFGANVLIVKHGDIKTMDLDVSSKRKTDAISLARTSLQEQLKIVRGDSYAVEVSSVQEAFDLLEPAEKASLLAGKPAASDDSLYLSSVSMGQSVRSPQDQLQHLAMNEQAKREAGQIMLMM